MYRSAVIGLLLLIPAGSGSPAAGFMSAEVTTGYLAAGGDASRAFSHSVIIRARLMPGFLFCERAVINVGQEAV